MTEPTPNAPTPDVVLGYIEKERDQLRDQFREVKSRIDGLHSQIAEKERELGQIKSRLFYTDELRKKRLDETTGNNSGTPALPSLGRFSNLGTKEAICELFDTDPAQELNTAAIADLLMREGFQTKATNLPATVFTTCMRLREDGYLESQMTNNVRYFRKRRGGSGFPKPPPQK